MNPSGFLIVFFSSFFGGHLIYTSNLHTCIYSAQGHYKESLSKKDEKLQTLQKTQGQKQNRVHGTFIETWNTVRI
jgi:hypothetical protein